MVFVLQLNNKQTNKKAATFNPASGRHNKSFYGRKHRDRTGARTLCCCFFSSFEHVKSLLIMDPTTLKTHQKV
jgi:hypothetical protein